MKALLAAVVILATFESISAQNSSVINVDQCFLFKYTNASDPDRSINKVRKANGIYADYIEFVVRSINAEQDNIVFYEYVAIYNKTKDLVVCEKIKAHCQTLTVPRKTIMNQDCYKVKDKVQKVKNDSQISDLESMIQFRDFFTETETEECENILKTLQADDSRHVCQEVAQKFYRFKVKETLINITDTWTFTVSTVLIILGLITNSICLAVFIHSKYLLPKMGNREQFMLFAISNLLYLSTHWYLFTQPPSFIASDWLVRNYPKLFAFLNCKLIFYVNLTSFFLSELMIVSISLHRVLSVFFPMKMILLSAKYPRFFTYLFIGVILVALGIPVLNLLFNTNVDISTADNITEKTNVSQYCSVTDLAGNITKDVKLSMAVFLIMTLTFSSVAIIVRLLMLKKKRKSMSKKMPKERNFFSAVFSKNSKSTVEGESSVAITHENKSLMESSAPTKTVKDSAQTKNDAINNMIIVLSIATVFFNIAYLVIFANMSSLYKNVVDKNFKRIVINRGVETILILVKFSITGLLFFVSGEVFRKNFYEMLAKCSGCIKCQE